MQRTWQIGLTVLAVGVISGLMWSARAMGKTDAPHHTLTGEVLDMSCYLTAGAHGRGHAACAAMCLKAGEPAGLLVGDKAYLLVGSHEHPQAYEQVRGMAADKVTVTGKLVDRGGVPGFVVEKVARAQ